MYSSYLPNLLFYSIFLHIFLHFIFTLFSLYFILFSLYFTLFYFIFSEGCFISEVKMEEIENIKNNKNKNNHQFELIEKAIEKDIFLLISCSVKNIEKNFKIHNKYENRDFQFPLNDNDKNDFFSEMSYNTEIRRFRLNNSKKNYLYSVPISFLKEDKEITDFAHNLHTENHGIDIEFASICLSPPVHDHSGTDGSRTVRTIEAELELLLLPSAKAKR